MLPRRHTLCPLIEAVAIGPESAHEWLRFGVIATPKHAPPAALR